VERVQVSLAELEVMQVEELEMAQVPDFERIRH
jgi:hypothetical protein